MSKKPFSRKENGLLDTARTVRGALPARRPPGAPAVPPVLQFAVSYRSRERQHVTDILHTGEIHHAALEAEPEVPYFLRSR